MTRAFQQRGRLFAVLAVITVSIVAIGLMAPVGSAVGSGSTTCYKSDNGCRATITLTEYTGPPPYPVCEQGVPFVLVSFSTDCVASGCSGGPETAILCGSQNNVLTYSACGKTHTLALTPGTSWEDVLNGHCGGLRYNAS